MLPISGRKSTSGNRRLISCCILNTALSAMSSPTMVWGRNRAICRHNSLPIEPPAPVTRIVRPSNFCRMFFSSRCTGFRPRRSSTATSRICASARTLTTNSANPGIVLHGTAAAWQCCRICAICAPRADGIAMRTSVIPFLLVSSASSWPEPSTATLSTSIPCFLWSSSIKPHTS